MKIDAVGPIRSPLTGPNKLHLPAINVVPPTPTLRQFNLDATHGPSGFPLEIDNDHLDYGDINVGNPSELPHRSHPHGSTDPTLQPLIPIDLNIIPRFAPLKHCYTENNRHMWEEDYQNWCFKAQYHFTTHHPELHIALPSTRAFGVAQRGPLERYMLEIDSFPLHPDSETFSTIISNKSNTSREYICFRCGKKKMGSFGSHEVECGYGIPPEQTVYYFAWETVPRPMREEMLLRVPRVWQDSARTEWGRTLCRLDRVSGEKVELESKYGGLKSELDGQGKRLRYLETELQRLMDKEGRDDRSGKKTRACGGKENVLAVELRSKAIDKPSSLDKDSSFRDKKQKRTLVRDTNQTKSKRQRIR